MGREDDVEARSAQRWRRDGKSELVDGQLGKLRPAFGDLVEVIGSDILKCLVGAAGPGDFDCGDGGGIAEAEVGTEVALGEIAAAAGDFADLVYVVRGDSDSGAGGVAVRFCAYEFKIHEMVFVKGVVVEKCGRIAVVGDEHVDVAIVIEIGEGDAAGCARRAGV